MASVLFIALNIILVSTEKRSFSPRNKPDLPSELITDRIQIESEPEFEFNPNIAQIGGDLSNDLSNELQLKKASQTKKRATINPDRVGIVLNPECFETQDAAFEFKDYLLDQYSCLNYKKDRNKIYKRVVSEGHSGWSLWFEHTENDNFDCLDQMIDLPDSTSSSCIESVNYSALQYVTECVSANTNYGTVNFWNLDCTDNAAGNMDNQFVYQQFDATANDNVVVIVLDTMIQTNHQEFNGIETMNLFTGRLGRRTQYGHGTHVAATIVGNFAGGAKNTKLLYYPVCQLGSGCDSADIESGYNTAIQHMQDNPGPKYVINYSVGGERDYGADDAQYQEWGEAINDAGGIWVTSAGNSGSDAIGFAPAFSEHAVTVGAHDSAGQEASFSNYGDCVDVYGPGVDVWSAYGTKNNRKDLSYYIAMSGTSMSSPNIAAVVVNLLKQNPAWMLNDIKQYMISNSRIVDNMNQPYLTCDDGAAAAMVKNDEEHQIRFKTRHGSHATGQIITIFIISIGVIVILVLAGFIIYKIIKRKNDKQLKSFGETHEISVETMQNDSPTESTVVTIATEIAEQKC